MIETPDFFIWLPQIERKRTRSHGSKILRVNGLRILQNYKVPSLLILQIYLWQIRVVLSLLLRMCQLVSLDDNMELIAPYTVDEIKCVVFSTKPAKASGMDGFNPTFYQNHWDIIGPVITSACIDYLQQCAFPSDLNNILLVLIPKKKVPESMCDLRPIALCNGVYKIMSKAEIFAEYYFTQSVCFYFLPQHS